MDKVILVSRQATDRTIRKGRALLYPKEGWYCFALFIFIVAVFNWGSILHSKFSRRKRRSTHIGASVDPEMTDPQNNLDAQHKHGFSLRRIPVALVNMYRVVSFRWTLEIGKTYTLNMAEVFVTMAYIIFLFVWAFINTTDLEGEKLDRSYWTNRAGTIAASQLPLITALGTKNNLVSLVTGVGYEQLNYVHRMMARVVIILLWVHGGSEVYLQSNFQSELQTIWLRCGIMAMVAFSLLCLVSLRPIRAGAYELFFYFHFASVLIFLVGAYFHTRYDDYQYWIWPCFVFWALDRFIRVLRFSAFYLSSLSLKYFGSKFKSSDSSLGRSVALQATAELLPTSGPISDVCIQLRVPCPPLFRWKPGQTAYITVPSVSRLPFEAHPFTIAAIDSKSDLDIVDEEFGSSADMNTTDGSGLRSDKDNDKNFATVNVLPAKLSGQENMKRQTKNDPFWSKERELVFLINSRDGFTKRLRDVAAKGLDGSGNGKAALTVLVDGPYGSSPELGCYDTTVLIAGGSGISYILPVFVDIIRGVRDDSSDCRRILFMWTVRDASHIKWIERTLMKALRLAPRNLTVSIRIHVTGTPIDINTVSRNREEESVHSGFDLEKGEDSISSAFLGHAAVSVVNGRPDFELTIREEIDVVDAGSRMCVCVCGSQGISRSVRRALTFPVSGPVSVMKGGPSVTLHVESFGYA